MGPLSSHEPAKSAEKYFVNNHVQQRRRSLWDRGTCPPIFMKGDIHGNVPQYFRSDVV